MRHGLCGIDIDIKDDLLNLARVCLDTSKVLFKVVVEGDVFFLSLAKVAEVSVNTMIDTDGFLPHSVLPVHSQGAWAGEFGAASY